MSHFCLWPTLCHQSLSLRRSVRLSRTARSVSEPIDIRERGVATQVGYQDVGVDLGVTLSVTEAQCSRM